MYRQMKRLNSPVKLRLHASACRNNFNIVAARVQFVRLVDDVTLDAADQNSPPNASGLFASNRSL